MQIQPKQKPQQQHHHHHLPFKQQFPFAQRQREAANIRKKYPTRTPVIVQRGHHHSMMMSHADVPDIQNRKYLVPQEMAMHQFMHVIRSRIRMPPAQALFFFVDDSSGAGGGGGGTTHRIPTTTATMGHLHEEYTDPDGFLYLLYTSENAFGGFLTLTTSS